MVIPTVQSGCNTRIDKCDSIAKSVRYRISKALSASLAIVENN